MRDTTRTKRDTSRSPTDTLAARRDSAAKRDTSRAVRVPVPARDDSLLRRDSILRRDSARVVVRDTVKQPLTAAEAPVLADPSGSFVWDRRDLFSTGALTVQDLLERVPGVTTLRSGWISQPMVGAFLGDPGRVRVFLDGLELEELDPRMRGIWDLTQIPLWALDDLRVERGASEIRIYMRSWRVERTTPYTRTDIYTGDQNTNLYRGLFGRRYAHGEALQIAAQQYGTDPGRNLESSDQLGVLARVGIARRGWSADAMLLRNDRSRGRTFSNALPDTIPAIESTRSDLYARFGWGTPDKGPWVQGLASGSKIAYGGQKAATTGQTGIPDTTAFRSQYVLSGGYVLGPLRASFTQRYRAGLFKRIATPTARVGMETRFLTLSALGEGRSLDSTRRIEGSAVMRPLNFVFLSGAAGSEQPKAIGSSARQFARVEAGLRLRDVWVTGGVMRRDAVVLRAPTIFYRTTVDTAEAAVQGAFATVRGRLWKALYVDVQAVQWGDTGSFYRPKYQARSELYISTSLLQRFPTGNFHLLASAVHEYRAGSAIPLPPGGAVETGGYRTISTLIQVRILTAEVFWNFRNVLGERYAQISGYPLPRLTNVYGVRWEFWN